ncbi:class A beta-lactamase-related serine hydrolase [Pendulispora rubella]|uniref:beta-lactamase n=1 Tax=Pendulispora rubella TaxID=2741070 RepID=A0ABZ2L4A2_9BACT
MHRTLAMALLLLAMGACSSSSTPAPLPIRVATAVVRAPELDRALATMAVETAGEFAKKGLTPEGLAIAVIDLRSGRSGAYRGDVSYYPASVVKLCYLAYYEASKDAQRLADTPELVRAVKDMVTVSSNDATGFVVDSITGTTSGPELTGEAWEAWKTKRDAVTAWYHRRGFPNLNAKQKTFCEDSYGREQAYRDGGKNRNRMSALEAARIFAEIVRGEVAGPAGTNEMMALLARESAEAKSEDGELENARLAGRALPKGSRIWAKSGDAYDVRHLVGRVLLPDGRDLVVAVFTQGVKSELDVIPRVYERIGAQSLL